MILTDEKSTNLSGMNHIRKSRDNTSYTAEARDTSSVGMTYNREKNSYTASRKDKG